MRFVLHSALMSESIAAGASSLPGRPSSPILGGVLIDATEGSVSWSSFNYERSTTRTVRADVADPGTAVVSGRLLSTIGGLLPRNADVTVAVGGSTLQVSAGRTRFGLPLMIAEDFPTLPRLDAGSAVCEVDAQVFADAVRTVGAFASSDNARPELGALNLTVSDGDMVLCATDSHMVARRHIAVEDFGPSADAVVMNVPAADLLATIKAVAASGLDPVRVLWDGNLLGLSSGHTSVTTRVLAEDFPAVARILHADTYHCCTTVQTADLAAMVKRAQAVADDEFAAIAITADDGTLGVVTLRSQSGSTGDEIDAEHHGPPRRLAVNARKFAATLAAVDEPVVTLGFQEVGHLCKVHPGKADVDGDRIGVPDTTTVAAIMGIRE